MFTFSWFSFPFHSVRDTILGFFFFFFFGVLRVSVFLSSIIKKETDFLFFIFTLQSLVYSCPKVLIKIHSYREKESNKLSATLLNIKKKRELRREKGTRTTLLFGCQMGKHFIRSMPPDVLLFFFLRKFIGKVEWNQMKYRYSISINDDVGFRRRSLSFYLSSGLFFRTLRFNSLSKLDKTQAIAYKTKPKNRTVFFFSLIKKVYLYTMPTASKH